MSIDHKTVQRCADLARLRLDESEIQSMTGHLNQILAYAESIQKIPTEGIVPSFFVSDFQNVTRPDQPESGLSTSEAMVNAPLQVQGFFKIPRAIENR